MRKARPRFRMIQGRVVLFGLAILLAPLARADTLEIEKAAPPKSFRFSRGSDPVQIEITLKYEVKGSSGGQIAFAAHDQKDRPLMVKPMPVVDVKQGSDSIVLSATVKSLGPDVKSVVVEAVLLSALRSGRRKEPGEIWDARLTYSVK